MSVKMMALFWEFEGLTLAEKLVGLKMGDYANDEGESIYPAVGTIVRHTGVAESTVREILSRFKKWELISAYGRHEKRRTVMYRLNVEMLQKGFPEGHERRVQPVEGPANGGSSQWTHEGPANGPNPSLNRQVEPPIFPLEEVEADFRKLWDAWKPFEMTKGDEAQALRKYAEIRQTGVGAERIALAARVYCPLSGVSGTIALSFN